jgi:hypothetical protein
MSVAADIDLETLFAAGTGGGPGASPCEGREKCPREPLFLAWWKRGCAHNSNPTRFCLPCRDVIQEIVARHGMAFCDLCSSPWILVRIEPLPR